MLAKGDLVRVPANSCLTQTQSELHMIDKYTYLEKPTLGIFIKYIETQALLFINENYWRVDLKNIRYVGVA
tara:strand:+ start:303 stop:515 length:213 start_codon:yes stop_codon:yes gene_type:complete